jgi:hypothetical protein
LVLKSDPFVVSHSPPKPKQSSEKLAWELRIAIAQHVEMAKSSLSVKQAAIIERDPDKK